MSEDLQQKYRFMTVMLPDEAKRTIILMTGARQTGKTTLARMMYPALRYINLDAPENREMLRQLHTAAWGSTVGNAVIDEAQKELIVFDKIKYAYDERSISFQVILGSSQILLLKNIRESLAGRVSMFELWPLMMCELLCPGDTKQPPFPLLEGLFSPHSLSEELERVPALLFDREDQARRDAEAYLLQWGGMPALLPLTSGERWKWLHDYEYTYLERDLADLARLQDLQPFRRFQKLSALRCGQLLNYSELARDADLSVDTARRYVEYLTLSYQVILLQPFYRNLTSSLVKTPKLYWLDLGLLKQLCGVRESRLGSLYEAMVVSELVKWIKTMQKRAEVYFYRTRSGLEIDVLLQTEYGVIGIEVKSRTRVDRCDLRPMQSVAGVLGNEWKGGLVIYKGNMIMKVGEPDIWAVPAYRLFT